MWWSGWTLPDDDPSMAKQVIKQLFSQSEFNKSILALLHEQNLIQDKLIERVLQVEGKVDILMKTRENPPPEDKQPPGYA
jgi:hypothetical protein